MNSKYLDAKGLAEELSISVDQAKKLITEGRIPAVDVGVGERVYWRIARADVDTWLEEQRAETARKYVKDAS